VQEGALREDLYYRLNVFPISLPPLRERGKDVELLAEHFLEYLNQLEGTNKQLGAAARDRLRRYSWPGNVRELRNLVQREFILAENVMELEELGSDDGAGPTRVSAGEGGLSEVRVGLALDDVERRMILATLDHCGGDKRRAAAMLGISLKTLYNRLNQYAGRVPGPSPSGI
jgi:DNA-binding NtrC family response regulator